MSESPITILIVDDDDVDVRVVRRALDRHRVSNPVVVARDGVEALSALRGEEGWPEMSSPCLVLLDWNMPRMNGREFLEEIRNDPLLKQTIVFVLTTSNDEMDRFQAYEYNVAGYLLKSEAGRDFMKHLPLLENFLITVKFPDKGYQPQAEEECLTGSC